MADDDSRARDLEAAIEAVVASYDGPEAINNLESAALPNKRAVIDAYLHLEPVLYMGFYASRGLNRDNLRYSVSERLYPAYDTLVEQIRRAQTYQERFHAATASPEGWAEDIVLDLFRSLPRLRHCLDGDLMATYDGDPAAKSVEEIVFSYPSLKATTAHRVAHVLHRSGVPLIPRIIAEHAHAKTGIDIHPAASIGERFFVDHGTGVVIGETTVIGNDVKVYQGVTLGALSAKRGSAALTGKRHPTIEDEVTIYAGATILGGETVIGRGSVIGGNVWLVKSVPPGSKVFGRAREPQDGEL